MLFSRSDILAGIEYRLIMSSARPSQRVLVVWRFLDGKPGHEAQSQGLVEALRRRVELEVFEIAASPAVRAMAAWLRGRFPLGPGLPAPDLLIGAGHATHWPMLAARRARGGRIVVLMRPSLPLKYFDFCLIPEHDHPPVRPGVFPTTGVLNPIVASGAKDQSKGLILIGGRSRHYDWEEAVLKEQLDRLLRADPAVDWWLTTSRRTPPATLEMLRALDVSRLHLVPHTETPPGWVARHLQDSGQVWVTPDSVSMLYEALTACDRVGILRTSASSGRSRVARSVDRMIREKHLSVIDPAERSSPCSALPSRPLAEADRLAGQLLQTILP